MWGSEIGILRAPPGLTSAAPVPGFEAGRSGEGETLLFLKKKKQKDFYTPGLGQPCHRVLRDGVQKSLFCFFFLRKKENPYFSAFTRLPWGLIVMARLDGDEARLTEILRAVRGPDGRDIVAGGRIEGLVSKNGMVQVSLETTREEAPFMEKARAEAQALLRAAPGVLNATVVLTGARAPAKPAAAHRAPHAPPDAGEKLLPLARHVIAVASGKGGVGKSTTAINLAVALAGMGLRVGLVDADIHGPSLPRMLGVDRRPDVRDKILVPIEAHGVACMSMGFMVPENQAMIWRGPMVMGALQQILGQTDWGPRDVMVVDLPPGTGDAQLTLTQRVKLDGVVIVSTPQDIALIDARRGVAMFEKVGTPILGLIENMSFFVCPHCGERADVFGHGGARDEAKKLGVAFLGEVPLRLAVREAGDGGAPVVIAAPADPAAVAFRDIAARVWRTLAAGTPA